MKLIAMLLAFAISPLAFAQGAREPDAAPSQRRAASEADAILSAIVQVKMKATEGARSAENLGSEREGTGVVIDDRGHIVTIGYVVVEADTIEVTTYDNRVIPARLVAYDHPTGIGLLRAGAPLAGVTPMPLGSAADLALRDPLMVLPFGGREKASVGYLLSRRKFSASWEYLLESALFVSPPTLQWAGAALVDRNGRLVGIGSLFLRAVSPEEALPGNMFVPIDVVKPILPELIASGRRQEPARPWLGLSTEEIQGHLIVSGVSAGGPAEKAGIRRGDIVVGIASQPVTSQEQLYRRMWALGAAGTQVPLRVLQGADLKDLAVHSIAREQHFRTRPAP